ncbi:protocadherin gamma-C5-like isoform X15 [Rana temporaria]|uniref:protocadherin gamma-C5-like isoform X15 n=1 Tax=Rana temporaria TaxID=8407 RepID=UPI001AACDE15|nr:protocadherin gamma-C5-like isoform X15 [Rana temporaria]
MDIQNSAETWKWQVKCFFFLCSWGWVSGQLRYSVVEESEPGTVVGNVAQDLGLKISDLSKRKLRMGSEGSRKYFAVNWENGALVVNEKIDRESQCGSSTSCVLPVEVVIENPLQLHRVMVEIMDINDNSPVFSNNERTIKITELIASPGARFTLESAHDLDVGTNGIKQYKLEPSPYFSLSVKNRKDGTVIPELVLEKVLDREEADRHHLILTAVDGGTPSRSGTTQIHVIVMDLNDNPPTFEKGSYKINLRENTAVNTILLKLNATDLDEGANGEIEYSFDDHTPDSIKRIFALNPSTGVISVIGPVDHEESRSFELSIRAKDKGVPEMEGSCVIHVEVDDVNDNTPEIVLTSLMTDVPEDTAIGTVVGLFRVNDKDLGPNGEVKLELPSNLPFKFKSSDDHYSLITDGALDRETMSQYVIDLVASDMGSPPLRTQKTIILKISDVNDNQPTFSQVTYSATVQENNKPGQLLVEVLASDPDEGENSNLVYSITDGQVGGSTISSFVYINPKTGNIYAQRSFDFEQVQVLQIPVKVEDSGSPKQFSNTTVYIFILDANDNSPSIFYPEHSDEFLAHQKIPRSAPGGYFVTKVNAVDLDSGHNAWLVYNFVNATDSSLFSISSQMGEIRTTRSFQENENQEQSLVISVSDHGEPPLSATMTIVITLEDTTIQENMKSQDLFPSSTNSSEITMYLIISLVAISAVSFITFTILLIKCLKKDSGGPAWCCKDDSEPNHYTGQYQPTLHLNSDGTLKYMEVRMAPTDPKGQCYKSCYSTMSDKNDINFMKPLNFPQLKSMFSENEALFPTLRGPGQQAQPNADWRISQAQRPGPSGAQPTEEAGVWPNNQFETERLQAMILASANEAAEGTSGLGGSTGTMGLSARYGPQFTLQHVPDYRQNVYIPGSTLTPTNAAGKRDGKGGGNKKKSGKKDKK